MENSTHNEQSIKEQETPNSEKINPVTPEQPNKDKKTNKKLLLVIAILVLLLAGVIFWFLTKDKATAPSPSPNQNPVQATKEGAQQTMLPFSINYAYTTSKEISAPSCNYSSKATVYSRPFAGGDKTTTLDTGESNNVVHSDIYENKIALVTDPSCNSKDGTTVWYSQDSGKTYTKIFSGKPLPPANSTTGWEQITSVKLSNDGKKILIAFLNDAGSNNVIKEINPDTTETKDLLTVNSAGVFLYGYDTAAKKVYYQTGCYNCDGGPNNGMFVYDITANKTATLFEETTLYISQIIANSALTKMLIIKGEGRETEIGGLGPGKPYTIEEFDTNTKTSKKLATINEETTINMGYRTGDDVPYYSKGKSLYAINNSGNSELIFEASKPLLKVLYVDKNNTVVSTGEYNNFVLTNYTISSKQVTNILNGDENTRLIGVSLK